MTTYVITGGAGFVGSSLAIRLKARRAESRVIAVDNLMRRGSELNLPRLRRAGVEFTHGDIRQFSDLLVANEVDCLIDCAAEPSALAGYGTSPAYVLGTNLTGTLNALELARRHGAAFLFLSSSRIYPYTTINALNYVEAETRFELSDGQTTAGVSRAGLTESFPLPGLRSMYGATKLASELIVAEYLEMYSLHGVVNRCGVIAGPWQMGKVDQGFVTHWVARHLFGGALAYKGFGGHGRQVRDIVHIDDLFDLIERQLDTLPTLSGQTFNVGGGVAISVSLCELTELCARLTGNRLHLGDPEETQPADVPLYLSDCTKVQTATGWTPGVSVESIVEDILKWMVDNRATLEPVLAPS